MSLISSPVNRNGQCIVPISNKYSITSTGFSSILQFGSSNFFQASDEFTILNDKILTVQTGRYKIHYSFLSKGIFNFAPFGYGRFQFGATNGLAGPVPLGKLSAFTTGIELNEFGISGYYSFSDDILNPSSIVVNSSIFSWDCYFNASFSTYLQSGSEIFFEFAGSNLSGTHSIGFDGYIILEKIS